MIAGFKLMYDQVKGPGRTVNGTNLGNPPNFWSGSEWSQILIV